jgi:hypothetical protein
LEYPPRGNYCFRRKNSLEKGFFKIKGRSVFEISVVRRFDDFRSVENGEIYTSRSERARNPAGRRREKSPCSRKTSFKTRTADLSHQVSLSVRSSLGKPFLRSSGQFCSKSI